MKIRNIFVVLALIVCAGPSSFATSRIKDIGHFTGVRNNSLIGYGLVIGLKGTGDKQQTVFTQQSLVNMLDRLGVTLNNQVIRVQNIAAVIVTADLPAFERPGSKIDVTVSSIGDAASLQGGILLQTPLLGPDSSMYAVAQGALVLGGFSAGNDTTGVTVNHPTVGRVPNGATVEKAVVAGMPQTVETLDLELDRTDFTNVKRVTEALNASFGRPIAVAIDGRSVRLALPVEYRQRPVEFIAAVEAVTVEMDTKARVVVNERTGTVIIGSEVTITPVSIAHGNLSIQIETQFNTSQPAPLSQGQTTVTPDQKVTAQEQKSNFVTINKNATVEDLIKVLNALGVTPRDTIAILEALKAAGSLQAELEINMIPDVTSIANPGGKAAPKDIAAKVQGMFMEVMLKSMEDSVGAEDGLFGNSATSDIYRGMLREHLAATMTKQMKTPLEGQLDKALNKSSKAHGGQTDSTESEPELPASGLPVSGVISSPEGWRRDPINGDTRYHAGTDIAAPAGTPIRAVAEGRVIESGVKGGYGNTVVIQGDDGRKMLYAHNNQNFVQTGDWVSRGEEIAEVGSSGRATGPHVHFEVKF